MVFELILNWSSVLNANKFNSQNNTLQVIYITVYYLWKHFYINISYSSFQSYSTFRHLERHFKKYFLNLDSRMGNVYRIPQKYILESTLKESQRMNYYYIRDEYFKWKKNIYKFNMILNWMNMILDLMLKTRLGLRSNRLRRNISHDSCLTFWPYFKNYSNRWIYELYLFELTQSRTIQMI